MSALAYDELPEGSALRREFDEQGGVTIVAPAGEVSDASRRWVAAGALLPACAACAACALGGGAWLYSLIRANDLDPSLRVAAFVALAVLAGGVFLFAWWGEFASRTSAMADARRQSTVLHADAQRLLIEREGPDAASIHIDTPEIKSIRAVVEPVGTDGRLRRPRVPFLRIDTVGGRSHSLLGGHHPAELQWIAAAVSEATGVAALVARAVTNSRASR